MAQKKEKQNHDSEPDVIDMVEMITQILSNYSWQPKIK